MNRGTEKLCAAEWSLEHEGTYEDFIERVCGDSKKFYQRLAKLRATEFAGEHKQSVDAGVLSEADAGAEHDGTAGLHGENDAHEATDAVSGVRRLHAEKLGSTDDKSLAA